MLAIVINDDEGTAEMKKQGISFYFRHPPPESHLLILYPGMKTCVGVSTAGVSLVRMHLSRGSGRDETYLADTVCELKPSLSVPWKLGKCMGP